MKKIIVGLLLISGLLVSCAGDGNSVNYNSSMPKQNYSLVLLFTIEDGSKVYRFVDAGHYHYFIKGKDSTMINTKEKHGKNSYIDDSAIESK